VGGFLRARWLAQSGGKHDDLACCRVFFHAAVGFRDLIEMKDPSCVDAESALCVPKTISELLT
jgi:hypothetical protein